MTYFEEPAACVEATWATPAADAQTPNTATPCTALADCPPGAECRPLCALCPPGCLGNDTCALRHMNDPGLGLGHFGGCRDCPEGNDERFCAPGRTNPPPVDAESPVDVPRFSIAVGPHSEGYSVELSGLPPAAHLARCAVYGCAVDGDSLRDNPNRCLIQSVDIQLPMSEAYRIPRSGPADDVLLFDACGTEAPDRPSTPLTAVTFSVTCSAYGPAGLLAMAPLTPIPIDGIGGWARGSFVDRCTTATEGAGCPIEVLGEDRPSGGICVGGLCCFSCLHGGDCAKFAYASCDFRETGDDGNPPLYGHCDSVCATADGVLVLECSPDGQYVYPEATEIYGDAVDQDCDGRVDEFEDNDCQDGMVKLPQDLTGWPNETCIGRFESSRPDATGASAGDVDERARSTGGVMPWVGLTAVEASDACTRAGMRLCNHTEWRAGCHRVVDRDVGNSCFEPAPGQCTPTWPYPYGPLYDADACNGLGSGAGQPVPTGSFPACVGGEGAVDIVGNVAEWVVSTENEEDRTYGVAGGDFGSRPDEANCGGFREMVGDERSPKIGFRCCKDMSEGGQ